MFTRPSIEKLVDQIQLFQKKAKETGKMELHSPEELIEYLASLDDESLQKTLQIAAMIAIGGNFKRPNV